MKSVLCSSPPASWKLLQCTLEEVRAKYIQYVHVYVHVHVCMFHFTRFLCVIIFVCCSLEGTPSLAKPGTVSAVVEEIAHCVHLPSDAEICLEANPTSAEVQKLRYGYF